MLSMITFIYKYIKIQNIMNQKEKFIMHLRKTENSAEFYSSTTLMNRQSKNYVELVVVVEVDCVVSDDCVVLGFLPSSVEVVVDVVDSLPPSLPAVGF